MAVIRNRDGRLEVFARGRWEDRPWGQLPPAVRRMVHIFQTAPNGNWSDWGILEGDLHSPPAAAINQDGRLETFALASDMFTLSLARTAQTVPSRGPWSPWESLGGELGSATPETAAHADGRIEVFTVAGNPRAIWHTGQRVPNAPPSEWEPWHVLGQNPPLASNRAPVLGRNDDGRLEVFILTRPRDVELLHIWQLEPNGQWSGWESLGPMVGIVPIGCGRNADGRLELFQIDVNFLRRRRQRLGGWEDWELINGAPGARALAVAQNADGRLEIFMRGSNDALWHTWQKVPNAPATEWADWESLGGILTSDPAVGQNADGRLEVFATGVDSRLHHLWQLRPNGDWSGWAPLGPAVISSLGSGGAFLF